MVRTVMYLNGQKIFVWHVASLKKIVINNKNKKIKKSNENKKIQKKTKTNKKYTKNKTRTLIVLDLLMVRA